MTAFLPGANGTAGNTRRTARAVKFAVVVLIASISTCLASNRPFTVREIVAGVLVYGWAFSYAIPARWWAMTEHSIRLGAILYGIATSVWLFGAKLCVAGWEPRASIAFAVLCSVIFSFIFAMSVHKLRGQRTASSRTIPV